MTASLLSACTTVKIKDHEFCGDKGSLGAACFHTLTDERRSYTKEEWDDHRFGQVCTNDPPDQMGATFADQKAVIETLCSVLKNDPFVHCKTEDLKKLEGFLKRMVEADPVTAHLILPTLRHIQ